MRLKAVVCGLILAAAPMLNAQDKSVPSLINQLHQREWVRLEADGRVHGRVVVIEASDRIAGRIDNKVLLSKEGKIVYETKTGTDGVFEIKGVAPGTYALQTVGDYTFAAFAIHIMPADANHLGSSLDVYASTIGDKARQLIAKATVPSDLEIGEDVYYRSYAKDPIANERRFSKNHQVTLQDGHLVGRVSRPGWSFAEQDLSDSVVRILKSGKIVAQTEVDKDGNYKVEKLEPGIYDLLVAGGDGFAAFMFEAVNPVKDPEAQASLKSDAGRLVSTNLVASDCLGCELIHQPEMSCCAPPPMATEVVADCGCAPMTGGGCCGGGGFGGGFGGGGAGGGGGGAGGIAGLAGIAGCSHCRQRRSSSSVSNRPII
jgi:uncharacterized membrane protein YgcG